MIQTSKIQKKCQDMNRKLQKQIKDITDMTDQIFNPESKVITDLTETQTNVKNYIMMKRKTE